VDIRPDLIGLDWARGAEPIPQGLLRVDARKSGATMAIAIDVPEGVVARVSVPVSSATARVTVNRAAAASTPAENGARAVVILDHAGHYQLAGE
jgi:alpha-L-rhamnosidase